MKRVIITGFDPFGKDEINPSWEAVKRLPDEIEGAKIEKIEIPTVFHKSVEELIQKIELSAPDIVICVGQAGGRFDITIERVAINLDDARIPDNENNQPIDKKIAEKGESAYFSNLPIKAMARKIREGGIPASVSNTAGTFVCNHIMYGLLHYINKNDLAKRGGFIHVPYIPSQVTNKPNVPSMALDDIVTGLTLAIRTAVTVEKDIEVTEGKIF
ncbi:pyroglutamyl-peptidase I [Proteinivorax tanatarense]|uniref:Pyrrolidone-carboxylate peptidase n=1 Tax=Proteinivorax tanatarense TaxID=1260629 RepID=A0AAU7VKP0_9FIRM